MATGLWASRRPLIGLLAFVLGALLVQESTSATSGSAGGYFGKFIGKLSTLHHSVSGDVYAVDSRTLHIRDFTYDGEAPDAFFYAGSTKNPSGSGFRIRDEKGTLNVLGKYKKKHVTLTLPEGKSLSNIRWFSVWCREFEVNFADVRIPPGFDFPKPLKLGAIDAGVHGVKSDPITIVDAQTLLVPNFSYDGEAPDAKFWVGRGDKPNSQGIRVADENGRLGTPLRRYERRTLVLTLPGDLTIFDIGHFGVWCEAFAVDFGHVTIPRGPPPPNVPPSLRMLGVSPQSKLNCEVLSDVDGFEVRWAVAGQSLVMQLVAKLDNGDYMSFGVSGEHDHSTMVGGDVVVAWLDSETYQGRADDYYLDAKSQCSGSRGSCPDNKLEDGTESARLLSAARSDGHTVITYQRPLRSVDNHYDKPIYINGTKQAFIWAIGPLNSRNEVSYHRIVNRHDVILDFGRYPEWNCPKSEGSASSEDEHHQPEPPVKEPEQVYEEQPPLEEELLEPIQRPSEFQTPKPAPQVNAWKIPPIPCHEPDDGVYYAQMGPTGGKRGYPAITGHVGWGISWYINGLLIPEINVVRGKTYTFVVEGGADPDTPARYHPLYITDDPIGGYQYKTETERAAVQVFAGVEWDPDNGEARPTATGRLCNWTPDPDKPADEATSFGAYQRTLSLVCDEQNEGRPGILRWTPDAHTPDTVYYQCFTHRYLGWKINVLDSCETEERHHGNRGGNQRQQSQRRASSRRGGRGRSRTSEEDSDRLVSGASIQISTRVKPEGANVGIKNDDSGLPKPKPTIRYVEIQRNRSAVTQDTPSSSEEEKTLSLDLKAPPTPGSERVLLPDRTSTRQRTPAIRRFQPPSTSFTNRFRPGPVTNNERGSPPRSHAPFRSIGSRENRPAPERGFRPNSEVAKPRRVPPPPPFSLKPKKKKIDTIFDSQSVENLEPMFIPSPPDLIRQNATEKEEEEETKMEANERVDSYSLPPKSQSSSSLVSHDGKPVDPALTSLVPTERNGNSRSRRPTSTRIQSTPQFGPFLGEVPPPVPDEVVPASLPQLRSSGSVSKGVKIEHPPELGEDLQTSPRKETERRTGSHRLTSPFKYSQERAKIGERRGSREKRAAHHEPGHYDDDKHMDDHGNEDNRLKMNSEQKKCEGKECKTDSSASAAIVANLGILVTQLALRAWF